jgi:hypothetical protein
MTGPAVVCSRQVPKKETSASLMTFLPLPAPVASLSDMMLDTKGSFFWLWVDLLWVMVSQCASLLI